MISRKIGSSYIPEYKFKCTNGMDGKVYYVQIEGVLYFRASDIWSGLTLKHRTLLPNHIKVSGDIAKVLIGKSTGCPSTRPVYALTLPQAIEVCQTFTRGKFPVGAHPLEKWLREKVAPREGQGKIEPTEQPAWTPDDVPKRVKPADVPQPDVTRPDVEPPAIRIAECEETPAPPYPNPVRSDAILPREPVDIKPEPQAAANVAPEGKISFYFNGRHVCNICAAKDDDGCIWVDTKSLEAVFGNLGRWPQSIKNAKRRVIHAAGVPYSAIHESEIANLRHALTPSELSIGTYFVRWLHETVKPTLESRQPMPLESRIATFFFKGLDHEIHVSSDGYGEIWASIPEIEDLFDLKIKDWPEKAKSSPKKMMAYDGKTFSAVSEQYIDDIANSSPPSRRCRAQSFSAWWTEIVWGVFGDAASPATPAPQSGSLIDQARDAAYLLLKLADENEALTSENARRKAALDSADKAQKIISQQKEALKSMIRSLE